MTDIAQATTQLQTLAVTLAAEIERDHPSQSVEPATLFAMAWYHQVNADLEARIARAVAAGNEESGRHAEIAKKMARIYHGDAINDTTMPLAGQEPMIHMMKITGKQVVSLGYNIAGAIPLWAHYIHVVRELEVGGKLTIKLK